MLLNIDNAIFIVFLVANLIFGLISSRGIRNIKEYAIGNQNFSTITIAATLVATWVSGETFFSFLSETHTNGLYFVWAAIAGDTVCFLAVGLFFAPRLAEFLGKMSIAEAMGDLYGKHVRIITAIAGFIGTSGLISIQLKVSGLLFEYCFNISSIYGVIISGAIITLYSASGGIKSVTFTDIIQLFTFGTIIPTLAYFILSTMDITMVKQVVSSHELFDYKQVFDFGSPKSLYYLFLFFFVAIPGFNPAIFQRIAMSRSTEQVGKSFVIAGFTCLFISLVMSLISVLILSTEPELNANDTIKHLIFGYSHIGFKGLILIGIMAMVMSTADSYINSTSILVVHDFCKPLKIMLIKNELTFSRFISLLIGTFSTILALREGGLVHLIVAANLFYMPIVTVPFIMALCGFRTTSKSVLVGMGAGFLAVVIWEMFLKSGAIDGLIPGMIANLIFLLGSHYLLKQPGGWVGIKDYTAVIRARQRRKVKFKKLFHDIMHFDFIATCKKNSPKGEFLYSLFGLFVMISSFGNISTLPQSTSVQFSYLLNSVYPVVLFVSTALISYPLWLQKWKEGAFITVFWNFIIFFILICFSFFLVIISNFSEVQLMIFIVNVIILSSFASWRWALFSIITGAIVTLFFYKYCLALDLVREEFSSTEFRIFYLLLMISSIMVIFLKPQQVYQELTELKANYLSQEVHDQKKELIKLQELKNEFLRNLEHEAHTPITGITSMGQVLWEGYDKLTEEQRREGIHNIAKSSERLTSLVDNLIDLSKLENFNYKLNRSKINLGNLIYKRLEICQKLYIEEKDKKNLNFNLDIEDKLIISCDEYYITRSIDSIIINAIQYCKKGKISIKLKSGANDTIKFSVQDEGIGIPEEELLDIFNPFMTSSRTKTPAGGRGIGLTLCKKVIDSHKGTIIAQNNKDKGSVFLLILPKQ